MHMPTTTENAEVEKVKHLANHQQFYYEMFLAIQLRK